MKECTKCGAKYRHEHIEDLYRDKERFQMNPFICEFCFAEMESQMKITHVRASGEVVDSMKGVKAPDQANRVIAEAERREVEKSIDCSANRSDNNNVIAS